MADYALLLTHDYQDCKKTLRYKLTDELGLNPGSLICMFNAQIGVRAGNRGWLDTAMIWFEHAQEEADRSGKR